MTVPGWLRSVFVAALVAGIFAYLAREVWVSLPALRGSLSLHATPVLLAYLALLLVCQLLLATGWWLILRNLGLRLSAVETLASFSIPNLGKYLPGKILLAAGRIESIKRLGGTRGLGANAFVAENLYLLLPATLLALPTVFPWLQIATSSNAVLFTAAAAVVVLFAWSKVDVLSRRLARVVPQHLTRRIPKDARLYLGAGPAMLYGLLWILYGLSGTMLTLGLFPNQQLGLIGLASAFVSAWLVGYLAVFTPGGLGIREGVLAGLLGPQIGFGEAGLLAVVARLLWTVAELGVASAALCLFRYSRGTGD